MKTTPMLLVLLASSLASAAPVLCEQCQSLDGARVRLIEIHKLGRNALLELRYDAWQLSQDILTKEQEKQDLQLEMVGLLQVPTADRDQHWHIRMFWIQYRLPQVTIEIAVTHGFLAAKEAEIRGKLKLLDILQRNINELWESIQECDCNDW